MALLKRRIRCTYCNAHSKTAYSQVPRQYLCPHCDATSYFNKYGQITDPPAEVIATAPSTSFRYTFSRSPSPLMSLPAKSTFCNACQHNQAMVAKIIAEYLPDEDDPEYEKLVAGYDNYRLGLERRYPQVCKDCAGRVDQQLQEAAYLARVDNVKRIMEKSEYKRRATQTSRQVWTLRLTTVAKWVYMASFFVQVLWHIFGYMMAPDERTWDGGEIPVTEQFSWDICLSQALHVRSVDEACVLSPTVSRIVRYALFADALTLWWNPRLKDKTNSITGRMRGVGSLCAIRGAVLFLRILSFNLWHDPAFNSNTLVGVHNAHLWVLSVMALSFVLTFKTVHITYQTPASFQGLSNPNAHMSNSAEEHLQNTLQPSDPRANAFDTMAQGFSSGFDDPNAAAYPPSPTLTSSSYTTHATEATTPFGHKSVQDENDMDWTPTRRGFAGQQPTIHPSPWAAPPSTTPKPREPHSIFAQRDPNPFRHRVPVAPKAPAQVKADPWKPGVWAPPPKQTAPNFFKQNHTAAEGVGETKGLDGFGVPKNVKRDAELFASPKLMYDYYGTEKKTGLEEKFEGAFNGLFSK